MVAKWNKKDLKTSFDSIFRPLPPEPAPRPSSQVEQATSASQIKINTSTSQSAILQSGVLDVASPQYLKREELDKPNGPNEKEK